MSKVNTSLTIEEFKNVFKTLNPNKACGANDINPYIIKSSYVQLLSPLFDIYAKSFSHLREHKFRHNFHDTINPFSLCKTNAWCQLFYPTCYTL